MDVGLAPIDPALWLLPDDQAHWLAGKRNLMASRLSEVLCEADAGHPAVLEAAEMVCAETGACGLAVGMPALAAAASLVSDDLVVMVPDGEGWRAMAACLCSPTFFSAQDAVGHTLSALHAPVPGGDPGLAGRIGRVFSMLRDGLVLERLNWTVQWGPERFTPSGAPLRAAAEAADVGEAAAMLHQRVERQTIRRLPRSGAVLFTIRIRLHPLALLIAEAEDRAAFARAWASASAEVRAYKRWAVLERHVHALLDLHR
jgi:dimethylamine monooxygenase subunit A